MSHKERDFQFKNSLRSTPPRPRATLTASQKKQVPVWRSGSGNIPFSQKERQPGSAPSSGTRSVASQGSEGTRFSVKEFKAVTGGTPGTAAAERDRGSGSSYEQTKLLTPDGFDISKVSAVSEISSRDTPTHHYDPLSPDTLLSQQLLQSANWQDILKEALAADTVQQHGHSGAVGDDEGDEDGGDGRSPHERAVAHALYHEAHNKPAGGLHLSSEERSFEVDADLVDRINGVKDQAEGRAVHLLELLGQVHEARFKKHPSAATTPPAAPAPATEGTGSETDPAQPPLASSSSMSSSSSSKRKTLRQQQPSASSTPQSEPRVTYSDFMKGQQQQKEHQQERDGRVAAATAGGGGANVDRSYLGDDGSVSMLTTSPAPVTGHAHFSPSSTIASSRMETPRSPPREVPLHKDHTISSSVKATPLIDTVPNSTVKNKNNNNINKNNTEEVAVPPFRPAGLGPNGSYLSATAASNASAATSARKKEAEQEYKIRMLYARVDHQAEQIARLERAILLVLDNKHHKQEPWVVVVKHEMGVLWHRTKQILAWMWGVCIGLLRLVLRMALALTSFAALYVVFFHCLKLLLLLVTKYRLPAYIVDPFVQAVELVMGCKWKQCTELTLPARLLGVYQEYVFPHVGYFGLCRVQSKIVEVLDIDELHGVCVLPLPKHDGPSFSLI